MPNAPLRYGHRGACGHAPENTRASMRKALELGVAGFEFDIQLSKDGEPVVIHDDTLDRTTNGRGKISDYSFWELQQFDAGGGERIPHLNDVFALADRRCDLLIELKTDAVEVTERLIRQWVNKGWEYQQLWVLSFDHAWLAKMHQSNPHIRICASFEEYPMDLAHTRHHTGAAAIGPCHHIIDDALVANAHRLGMKIITWTVNDPHDIAAAKAHGVDGIISDFPERL